MPRSGEVEDQEGCPTPTAHKRLEEVHRLWHECLAAYQDPVGFRTYLNACIQALRNVTWVLQKEKRLIEGFEDWYPAWQKRMGEDEIMRWVIRSRNRIVKEGDLETESRAIARVIMSYADAAVEVNEGLGRRDSDADPEGSAGEKVKEISAPPRYGFDAIVRMIAALPIPRRVLRQSTLTIERRWVDRALLGHELLGAMAHACGVLQQLVNDAHDRISREHGILISHGDGVVLDTRDLNQGRLPCMVTSRRLRTLSISLDDLRPERGGAAWPVEYDEDVAAKAREKYGGVPAGLMTGHGPVDLVDLFAQLGRQILLTDTDHGWFVHYFVGRNRVHAEVLAARNNADKRDLAQRMAEVVAMNGIDGLIIVGETWLSPVTHDDEGAVISPGEHPDRTEALMIHAEEASGRGRSVHLPFERIEGQPASKVGEPIDTSHTLYQFLEPVRSVWRQQAT